MRNGGGAFVNSGGAVQQVSRSLRFWIGWIRSPSAGYEDWGILRAWLESVPDLVHEFGVKSTRDPPQDITQMVLYI